MHLIRGRLGDRRPGNLLASGLDAVGGGHLGDDLLLAGRSGDGDDGGALVQRRDRRPAGRSAARRRSRSSVVTATRVTTICRPSVTASVSAGVTVSVAARMMFWAASTSATVRAPVCTDDGGAAGHRQRDGPQGVCRHGQSVERDLARAVGGQIKCRRVLPELHQGVVHGVRGGPHVALGTVDGEAEQAPALEGDLRAVLDLGAGRGSQDVVVARLQPGGGQRTLDRTGQGGHLALLAVDRDGHTLRQGGGRAAADGQQADGRRCGHQDRLAAQSGPAGAGDLVAVDRGAVGGCRCYRPGRPSMLLKSIRRTSAAVRRQRCRGARSRHIPWISWFPGRGHRGGRAM